MTPGQPLPEYGACKHYKKSFRWFRLVPRQFAKDCRFPCCGKLYPCDECHADKEKDHEIEMAKRMVCGYCSSEQPFQKDKPCVTCQEAVTRVKSSYWEGGRGCRDQTLMSRSLSPSGAHSLQT